MASIFDKQFSRELDSYTRGLLRKVSEKTKIPLETLIGHAFDLESSFHENETSELEYININGAEYLMNASTRALYSYSDPKKCLGTLNKFNEPIITSAKVPENTKPETTKSKKRVPVIPTAA
jgi:hypothetical protein